MSFSFSPPSFGSSNDQFDKQAQDIFDKFGHQVDSSMKWAVAESIIYGVVIIIAIGAVVYAIMECLKKAGTVIPAYSQVPTTEEHHKASKSSHSTPEVAIAIPPDSQGEFATMERFISNINKEKPIRFTPEQLEEITNNYSTILGSGGYGMVYKGELSNGEKVAVKVLKSLSMGIEEQFKAEVSTIGRTYHINLVRLFGFCFHHDNRALVYEYVENGSLDNLLFGSHNHEIEVDKLHKIAIGTAKGIAYLHEECQQRIIHYDIKPENILLDKNLEPKVADFGLAKLCSRESNDSVVTQFKGTKGYAAPEMWKPHPVTYKCDVYSFGILLFEIVGRRRHFGYDYSESQQWFPKWAWDMFENNELEVMLSLCGIEEKDKEKAKRMLMVALWCVQYLPGDRPLMSTVVKMLEGDTEISRPPFPFQNLVSCNPNLTPNGGSEDSVTSGSWQTDSSAQSEKAAVIVKFKEDGLRAVIGDGMNDAPALATANIGISMGISGSALAIETGRAILMTNDIRKIPEGIKLARRTSRKLIENVIVSIATQGAILLLAFAGYPLVWLAVLADVGTCLLVILNSMRIVEEKDKSERVSVTSNSKYRTFLEDKTATLLDKNCDIEERGLLSAKNCGKRCCNNA